MLKSEWTNEWIVSVIWAQTVNDSDEYDVVSSVARH